MKKLFAMLLVLSMMLSLAACGSSAEAGLKTVEKGKLIMATNAAFPPYEYIEGNNVVGIDAEIAQAIADKIGMTLEIQDTEFGSIVAGVQTGKYDMGMAGLTVTEDRLKKVDFSSTYATGVQVVIVKEGGKINAIEDLDPYYLPKE